MSRKTAFFDVDTQRDFMVPRGRLYVPGARMVSTNIRRLIAHAAERGIRLFSSVDAHPEGDPEFKVFPPHCVVGTRGQEKIRGTILPDHVVVGMAARLSRKALADALGHDQIIIEKQSYDVFDNPNTKALIRASGCTRFVVFGVATDICVRAAALGLLRSGFRVALVTDAIKGVTAEGTRAALAEMRQAGARLRITDRIVS